MKYTIVYGRKVRTKAYEMLDISLSMEFDTAVTPMEMAFGTVKAQVDKWISGERDRLLAEAVPGPETSEGPSLTKTGEIMEALGPELSDQLTFDDSGDFIVVRAKRYFGDRQVWSEINDVIGSFDGSWVSAGKDSRWEVPK